MKTLTKIVLGSALAGSAVAANAATLSIPLPSAGSSDLILVVRDQSNGTSYAVVLNQTVGNAAGSYFDATAATQPGPVQNTTLGVINGDANFSYNLSGDTGLQSFISTAQGLGQTLSWGVMSGAYTSSTTLGREAQGQVMVVTTASNSVLGLNESAIDNAVPVDINTDIHSLTLQTSDGNSPPGTGPNGQFGQSGKLDAALNLYGTGVTQAAAFGTGMNFYGLTTNGGSSGQGLGYLLGTMAFNGTTLSFVGETAAVPIPAAGWLFGSGLLGLLGIARRKRSALETA